jgi:hypothetical protein
MLVDNKFIYISIPRCASTSFHYSCILQNLDLKFVSEFINEDNKKTDFTKVDKQDLVDLMRHNHENLFDLEKKFGNNYPIICVKRNRYERFFSLFKQVISECEKVGANNIAEFLKNINVNELFFFSTDAVLNKTNRINIINEYLLRNNLIKKRVTLENTRVDVGETIEEKQKKIDSYIVNIFEILLTPVSNYHHHHKDIIWFDFDKLNELEKWVCEKLDKPFVLENTNSSKKIETKIKLDTQFIKLYNDIYNHYDITKQNKTLL